MRLEYYFPIFTLFRFQETVERNLYEYVHFVIDGVKNYDYDGEVEGWDTDWTFPNALLFTISIFTLIGKSNL